MESKCDNSWCKKKERKYRDEIYALEDDIRDKDEFAQKVVRQKNSYHAEISVLKKNVLDLTKKNEELEQKVEQLDEDADDGVMMLRNSHERERKLQEELDETKKKNLNKEDAEKERNEIRIKFNFVKDRLEKSLKENQDLKSQNEAEIKSLENKLLQSGRDLSKNEIKIEELEVEISKIKQKNHDLLDELEAKQGKVNELEEQIVQNETMKKSGNSLCAELQQASAFKCECCEKGFITQEDLIRHFKDVHEIKTEKRKLLLNRLENLEKEVSNEKIQLLASIYKLKRKETSESQKCRCKGFCRIHHNKHNFTKSRSDELLKKFQTFHTGKELGESLVLATQATGGIQKKYK